MKILHTSDWHLGKRLENFSRLEEQKLVMTEIVSIAKKENVDAVVIAGDLFDTYSPPNEATDLFYKTVKALSNNGKTAVIAIAGNHDSPVHIESPNPLAKECGILLAGYPNYKSPGIELSTGLKVLQIEEGFIELKLPRQETPLRLLITPYANEFRLKQYLSAEDEEAQLREILAKKWGDLSQKYCDENGVNLLVTHLFMMNKGGEQPDEPDDEKPILHIGGAQAIFTENIPDAMQYVALGHLHRKQTISHNPCPVVYCGTPLAYSFAEANQNKSVAIIDVEAGEPAKVSHIPLLQGKQLKRRRFEAIQEAINWLEENRDCLVELTIVSENYLSATERKALHKAHGGIVTIIPELKNGSTNDGDPHTKIDLTHSMTTLFNGFFEHKTGQTPNDRLLALFNEVMGKEE